MTSGKNSNSNPVRTDTLPARLASLNHDSTSLQQLGFIHILQALEERLATPFGSDKLDAMRFSSSLPEVQTWLDETREMAGLLESAYPVTLSGFHDIRPALEKNRPANAYLETEDLLDIKSWLFQCGELTHQLRAKRAEAPLAARYADNIHYHRNIVQEIDATIDPNGEVVDNASPELRKIRIRIRGLESDNKRALQRAQKQYGEFSQDEIVTLRDGRMVLGILPSFVNKVDGIVHGTSASGATVFVEPLETLKISSEIQRLRLQERNEIVKILRFISGLIREVREDIYFGLENLAQLDLIKAKAQLAVDLQAHAPQLTAERVLDLKQARHPLLILKQGSQAVVPLDLCLGDDFSTLVITGPNAGGKTVSMKTTGLLVLMTRMGMLIPAAADSRIPLLENVMADIGDRQSLENDLSTFSAHVLRLKEILQKSTPASLVLLDEAGTGTDPREGAALAIAVLAELTGRGILTIATTHHGELKAFAHQQAAVENSSMEFDLKTLLPTYRLRVGVPGSSYAFEISRRYGLPDSLIERARRQLGQDRNRLEDLILSLEARLLEQEKERREVSIKLTAAQAMTSLYERQVAELKKNRKELQLKAASDAEKLLQDANALIEKSVAEIRTKKASREVIKEAHAALEEQRQKIRAVLEAGKPAPRDNSALLKGEAVRVESLREVGVLLEDVGQKRQVRVLVNNIKMKLDVSGLQPAGKSEVREEPVVRRMSGAEVDAAPAGVGMELDVRGLFPEKAIEETSEYLAAAVEGGWQEVRIVHGKGSGALRNAINQFLARDQRVATKRLGRYGEGDSGVTVVTLRITNDQ